MNARQNAVENGETRTKPDAEKYPADTGDKHYIHTPLAVSQEQVADNFKKYGLLDDNVVFLKGWFKDTLPTAPLGSRTG